MLLAYSAIFLVGVAVGFVSLKILILSEQLDEELRSLELQGQYHVQP